MKRREFLSMYTVGANRLLNAAIAKGPHVNWGPVKWTPKPEDI